MRVSTKSVVVFSDEGDFLEVPFPHPLPRVGQVIDVQLKKKKSFFPLMAAAAVFLLVLAIGLFNPLPGLEAAAAYVALDLNPGINLFVDDQARVIRAEALNKDGRTLLSSLKVAGLDVYRAVDRIVRESGALGYLNKEGGNLVLASVISIKESGVNLIDEARMRGMISDVLKAQDFPGYVVVSRAREDATRQAKKIGLPVNKYLVYQRLRENGSTMSPDLIRESTIQQVLNMSGVSAASLFGRQGCEIVRQVRSKESKNSSSSMVPQGMMNGNTSGKSTGKGRCWKAVKVPELET